MNCAKIQNKEITLNMKTSSAPWLSLRSCKQVYNNVLSSQVCFIDYNYELVGTIC